MNKKIAMFCLCVVIAIFVIPSAIFAASFDCGKAKTEVEKLICGDNELSKLDESLNKMYLRALNRDDTKKQTIESQRQWLKYERDVCQDAACIKNAYATRIKELSLSSSVEQASENSLPLSSSQPPRELATNAEVILISGYEPANKKTSDATVNVEIDRPGSRVLLILTSHRKINWQIYASPSTTISGILTWGVESPTVTTTIPTQGFLVELPYTYETENVNFKDLLITLNDLFGIEKLDVFRGNHSIPSVVRISTLDPPCAELTARGPLPQKPEKNFTFHLITTSYKKAVWSLTGPVHDEDESYIGEAKFAISTSGKVIYRLRDKGLEISDQLGGNREVATLPSNFPKFSHPMDIAYDSKRDIVSVATLGGEGFLYRFDARRKKWIDFRSLNNRDIFSLSYDELKDRYVAWAYPWIRHGSLLFISGDGNTLFSRDVLPKLAGYGRLYDGHGPPPRMTIVPHGDDIVLVYIDGNSVKNIWCYSVLNDTAVFTYLNENRLKQLKQDTEKKEIAQVQHPAPTQSPPAEKIETVKSAWMTNEKERAICKAVVDAVNNGSIAKRFIPFETASDNDRRAWKENRSNISHLYLYQTLKINAHGKLITLGLVQGGGTCGNCDIEDINALVTAVYPPDDSEERFRWMGWGQCDHFLFVEGEPVIVTGKFGWGHSHATFVTWLAPDGAKRALCYLGPEQPRKIKIKLVTNNNPELCDAVAKSRVEEIPWSTSLTIPRENTGNDATKWDFSKDAMLDINLDGIKETIVLFDHASGAGCGSYRQWLREFTPQQRSAFPEGPQSSTETPLNKIFSSSGSGPVKNTIEGDEWHTVKLFRYAGRPYILGAGTEAGAEVISVWENQKKSWCEYQVLPQHKVEIYYPVETWPPLTTSDFKKTKKAKGDVVKTIK